MGALGVPSCTGRLVARFNIVSLRTTGLIMVDLIVVWGLGMPRSDLRHIFSFRDRTHCRHADGM